MDNATTAEKAARLVFDYARLRDEIEATTKRIAEKLGACTGNEIDPESNTLIIRRATSHLSEWYRPDIDEYGKNVYPEFDRSECEHCWAAHELVQHRKLLRRKVGAVKGGILKLGRSMVYAAPSLQEQQS